MCAVGPLPGGVYQPQREERPPQPAEPAPERHSWVDGWAPEELPDWIDIMLRPRRTIRRIVDADATRHVLLLAALSGMVSSVGSDFIGLASDAALRSWFGYWIAPLLALSAVLGALLGVIGLYIGGALYGVIGRWLGGNAYNQEVRAAIAWSGVVNILAGTLRAVTTIGRWALTSLWPQPSTGLSLLLSLASLGGVVIWVVGATLQLVIITLTLAEVNGFSAWRGLATWLLAVLAIGVLAGIVGACAALLLMQWIGR